jgi:protein phosphatase
MNTAQPPISRYLWAANRQATWICADELVGNRYQIISAQLWLDTKPHEPPDLLFPLPNQALAYAHLYQYNLHIPQIYGFCTIVQSGIEIEIPLLENMPIDRYGNLMPSLVDRWNTATPLNQAYWLWQIINLWAPLAGTGVLSSLMVMDNLRVDGWRIRLCELIPDYSIDDSKVTLAKLGTLWLETFPGAAPEIADRLYAILLKMQTVKASLRDVSAQLNQIVLEQTANLTLMWQIANGTNVDPIQQDHHDADHPTPLELDRDPTGEKLAIICDGIAGNLEGEAASQLAVKLLNIQTHNLFDDLLDRQDTATPEQIYNAISAIVRVVNNTIVAQHQNQRKQERRRMATTMVMAAQINQRVPSDDGSINFSHEIYIAHVGNSRAYWITADRCELLTIDDNIATRAVKQGRDLPWHSTIPPGATVLTQALGIDVGETIHPTIQRFMALEDGILLLCSNSLSDDNFVESSWPKYADNILNQGIPLDTAVRSWLALAHQQHGENNSSMIPISCYVSPQISRLPSIQTMSIVKPTKNLANSAESSLTLLDKKTSYLPLIMTVIVGLSIALVIAVSMLRPNQNTTNSNKPNQIDRQE